MSDEETEVQNRSASDAAPETEHPTSTYEKQLYNGSIKRQAYRDGIREDDGDLTEHAACQHHEDKAQNDEPKGVCGENRERGVRGVSGTGKMSGVIRNRRDR